MSFRRTALSALSLSVAALSVPALMTQGAQAQGAAAPAAMTPQDLVTLRRVGAAAASPDGRLIVWQQTETDPVTYARKTSLWRSVNGGAPEQITDLPAGNTTAPAISPDGKRLYFIAPRDGVDQLWVKYLDSPDLVADPLSAFKSDVAGFSLSPDGRRVVVWGEVARDCPTLGCSPAVNTALTGPGTGRHYRDGVGFVRHWDTWATPGTYNRAFAYTFGADGRIGGNGVPLDGAVGATGAITGDTPGKPFGGGEDIAWSADSASVFFVARLSNRDEPTSTNLDIWQSKLDGQGPVNLTPTNRATDAMPVVSPDGQWLAWAAMARPGYESDRMVVHLRNLKTGQTRALTQGWDRSVASLAWNADGKSLIATADEVLDHPAFRIDAKTGAVTRLSLNATGEREGHIAAVIPLKGGAMLVSHDTATRPAELFLRPAKGAARQISAANTAHLARIAPVSVSRYSFTGANGETVWGMVHKPVGVTGRLPVLLVVHGGPQGSFGDDWSYRWNPRVMAARGLAVVTIDFHGSTGYGQAFTDSINRNWGGWPLIDLQKGLEAAIAADPQMDGTRACAAGASYGGYMMNWIAGQWPDRFKCLVQHDGVFDARAMAYETEELWFDEWEHGGKTYYQAPEEFEKWNPVHHVAQWKTPMLVITGQNDFRIPYTQGIAAFTALQRRGVPGELLVFPDENHWVTKPKNSLQWHAAVLGWVDRWLKN
ncbi:prolyl oligopeptidase family serine peptidase [Novosphingobium sp. FSY-8]|uniref:Prolyl oligopeptidase family serine peptidase n=1 Tax=Novosphingobium ovatum TaxID=1908523 RepID=A0ABW9XHM3_9SPHN|nr:S9 family peptidase [Novosphingobium ovatum]NBC37991.1 prolyl oligopeptidase family serine peptidase [Novosphingobium ovatum]